MPSSGSSIGYARFCQQHYDPDGLTELFTADAVGEGSGIGKYEGRQAIHAFWAGVSRIITFAVPHLTGHTIEFAPSGVEASGHWYNWEPVTVGGRAMFAAATHDDRYRKVNGRWLFSHLSVTVHFLTPYESGWVREPFAALGIARSAPETRRSAGR